ncbi:MAG: Hsp20/alpha crystallin family protein [Planctomycetaceae bacterium]
MKTGSTIPRFSLFDELDRGLNRFVNEVLVPEGSNRRQPAISVYEYADRFLVECDVPGVRLEDIDVQLKDGVLEISGERKSREESSGVKTTMNERRFSAFGRKLQLGKDVDVNGVDAELENGVLRVTIPKAESVMPRQIQIRKVENPTA